MEMENSTVFTDDESPSPSPLPSSLDDDLSEDISDGSDGSDGSDDLNGSDGSDISDGSDGSINDELDDDVNGEINEEDDPVSSPLPPASIDRESHLESTIVSLMKFFMLVSASVLLISLSVSLMAKYM